MRNDRMDYTFQYISPIGKMLMAGDGEALTGLWFEGQKYYADTLDAAHHMEAPLPVFAQTSLWLDQYFAGTEPEFTPPLHLTGTPFRREVWEILLTIPYGETMTYGDIAKILAGRRGISGMSAQAAGGAVGHNPVSLIVPCHRVTGADGSLTGYAGGLDKKRWLLEHEKKGDGVLQLSGSLLWCGRQT